MKKLIGIILAAVLLAGVFVLVLVTRNNNSGPDTEKQAARTIIPDADAASGEETSNLQEILTYDELQVKPLIVLEPDEIFVQALTVDLNKDETPDQICAVKKSTRPEIYLVPGIQNPITGVYTRLESVPTAITQTRTFIFYSMDVIGDRNYAIVCSGLTDDIIQVLSVFRPEIREGKTFLQSVAEIQSDGSITIQENSRSSAYNLGLTSGDSFPIISLNSDPAAPQSLDQIERTYRWNRISGRYELASEREIKGKKIESVLLIQLRNGNINAFEDFLDGLWYITSAAPDSRYLFFDNAKNELVFYTGETEEIFARDSISPRRNGVYMVTHNETIASIRRLMDIELAGTDEIRMKVHEDVQLKIGVGSNWDGTYRKMQNTAAMPVNESTRLLSQVRQIIDVSQEEWISAAGQTIILSNNAYTLNRTTGSETGRCALLSVQGRPVFQFKPDSANGKSTFYLVDAGSKMEKGETIQTLTLSEVSISMNTILFEGSPALTFLRKI
ncbi:pallilysin-related adhesin [Brucepastera parasyntrophica]|uniref:pallilysin-related adhesin n=1 Tax=Brucepastera parasyntrophica TaxID=2880008 RepID=UPI00210E74F8|nr:pallilysin-related adhesin [Brucepastera parasyntrophica]ULQ60598.1 pallilysin-related adhesin [Brucepastera parasyntrophica]